MESADENFDITSLELTPLSRLASVATLVWPFLKNIGLLLVILTPFYPSLWLVWMGIKKSGSYDSLF